MKNNSIIIIILGVVVALMAALLFRLKLFTVEEEEDDLRLFTVEELALYNGTHPDLPILLGILGSVFDVTKGKSHYGPGGGYNHFAGRDASCAFVSGNFTGDGLTDSLQGLYSSEASQQNNKTFEINSNMPFVGAAVVTRASLGSLQLVGATQNSQIQGKKVPSFTRKMTGRSEQGRAFFVGDEHGNVVHPTGKRRTPKRGPVSQPL